MVFPAPSTDPGKDTTLTTISGAYLKNSSPSTLAVLSADVGEYHLLMHYLHRPACLPKIRKSSEAGTMIVHVIYDSGHGFRCLIDVCLFINLCKTNICPIYALFQAQFQML